MCLLLLTHRCIFVFFFKQKTAYEMRISDWSSDVCSSDLPPPHVPLRRRIPRRQGGNGHPTRPRKKRYSLLADATHRSEEHTSELQSLMRISYAVFCLKKKISKHNTHKTLEQSLNNNKQIKNHQYTHTNTRIAPYKHNNYNNK